MCAQQDSDQQAGKRLRCPPGDALDSDLSLGLVRMPSCRKC